MDIDLPLIDRIGNKLMQLGFFLTTAESCTGGLIGHMITNLPGSSEFFLGGHIVYANAAKFRFLGVTPETLTAHGAVSKETVRAMARGVRDSFADDVPVEKIVGAAVSGIAGPGGGTAEKPVGTVWIGISGSGIAIEKRFQFEGSRDSVKQQAATHALHLVDEALSEIIF